MKPSTYIAMKKYSFLLLVVFILSGCQKFLDVVPKGKFIPKYIKDYEELSSNPSYASNCNAVLERLSDNFYFSDARIAVSLTQNTTKAYQWKPELYISTETDSGWDPMYNNIYNTNIIIEAVEKLTDGTEQQRKVVLGDAFFNRAFAYWNLVNLYAKDYDANTAATDLGVPLITVADLEGKPTRTNVAAVYDLILQDLLKAKDQLPDVAKNVYRNNKIAAFAMLARVYQSMDNYPEAKKYADMALQLNSTLFDYNLMSFKDPLKPLGGVNNRPLDNLNPEMISYKLTGFSNILTNSSISPDFLSLLGTKDLRYVFNFTTLDRLGKPNPDLYPLYIARNLSYNISVPEMMLISAEAEARAGQTAPAIKLLNDLRKKRFKPVDYADLTAATADDALKLVIDERRRELFGMGLRWFDMRRLDNDSRFRKTYTRANTAAIYKLEAGSNIFVQQIPGKVMLLNPGILPNPR
ncbi:SusD family protein [compost metagenome]